MFTNTVFYLYPERLAGRGLYRPACPHQFREGIAVLVAAHSEVTAGEVDTTGRGLERVAATTGRFIDAGRTITISSGNRSLAVLLPGLLRRLLQRGVEETGH